MRSGGAQPLTPTRKWQVITVGTLLLVPACWSMMTGLVALAAEADEETPPVDPGAALALGLALIPFVFVVVAFMSGHPRAPGAVVKAMVLSLVVGISASALAGDAISGIVAGVGAGGAVALRPTEQGDWRPRAIGVAVAALYTFVLVRTLGALTLLPAPVFPLTAVGLADHLDERRREREATGA